MDTEATVCRYLVSHGRITEHPRSLKQIQPMLDQLTDAEIAKAISASDYPQDLEKIIQHITRPSGVQQ